MSSPYFPALLLCSSLACLAGATTPASPSAAAKLRLRIPYDIELDRAGRIWIADGGRHQVLRYSPKTRRMIVVAGTGARGSSGDGRAARRSRLDEVVDLVFDRAGNLYLSDIASNRVRRIDRRGVITTVARMGAPAALSLHPSGRYIAISSLESTVRRLDLSNGRLERLAGDGTPESTGDGGPAAVAHVNAPHGLAYDRAGNLYLADGGNRIRRIDAASGIIRTVATMPIYRLAFARDGQLYGIDGEPSGGRVKRIDPNGSATVVAGSGRISRHRDRVRATRVGIGPTALAFPAGGTMLIAQTKPAPAIRRLSLRTGILTTVYR